MDVSHGDIGKLTRALEGMRYELKRIADYLSPIGAEVPDKGREVKYEELVSYVDGLRAEGPFLGYLASGLESRIWRVLVETLLGVRLGLTKDIQATAIPLARLREGVALGCGGFTNMGKASWQIYTNFVKTIS